MILSTQIEIAMSLNFELMMASNAAWRSWWVDLAQMTAVSTMVSPVVLSVASRTAETALLTVLGEPPTGASALDPQGSAFESPRSARSYVNDLDRWSTRLMMPQSLSRRQ